MADSNASILSPINQLNAPNQGEKVNELQNKLFLASLELHEAWVRETPQLEKELRSISALLRNPLAFPGEPTKQLWQILFMIIPVVSTTLASVERMFAPLPPSSIGHVIIDEAGQATPQSLCGILSRAVKAIVIGDQRQLEPVVLTPKALESALAFSIPNDIRIKTSPIFSTAQSLADEHSRLGTYFGNGGDRVWMSTPLCVHRRCFEPMFSIANEIAYNGIMIQGNTPTSLDSAIGMSAWFQVKGQATIKQWVPEQAHCLEVLLKRSLMHDVSLPDLFIVTPFREVRARLVQRLKHFSDEVGLSPEAHSDLRSRIGTVHMFQGKEADVVILVLGCDFNTTGAADWVGEKPNLVNVAVTRARKFLYVIGDQDVWHNRGYFSDLQKALPRVEADWS